MNFLIALGIFIGLLCIADLDLMWKRILFFPVLLILLGFIYSGFIL